MNQPPVAAGPSGELADSIGRVEPASDTASGRRTSARRRPDQIRGSVLRRPVLVSLAAIAIRAVALSIIVGLAGARSIGRPLDHLRVDWIGVVAAAELLTYAAYAVAFRSVTRLGRRDRLSLSTVVRIVVAGFGPLALSGGFGHDRSALHALEPAHESGAQVGVGAMATIEWAVLAPATWLVAIVLLVSGADVGGSLLWPWALGLPALIAAAMWATSIGRLERLSVTSGRRTELLAHALQGIASVRIMARQPKRYAGAWIGTAAYWAAEIGALTAALRSVGIDLGIAMSTLAYATGYLASRRSLPLGGAGLTEGLLVYSLWTLHQPLGPSIDAVMIYRVFNFLLTVVPALVAYHGLAHAAAETGTNPPER